MNRFVEVGTLPSGPSLKTLASAMDVSRPSNLERLVSIFDGDVAALERWILPTHHDDDAVLAAMERLHREIGYFLDPHTAVGYLGLEEYRRERPGDAGFILSTADPAKFPATVEKATGLKPPERRDWQATGDGSGERSAAAATALANATVRLGPEPDELRELVRSS
jgi:threonine synthase